MLKENTYMHTCRQEWRYLFDFLEYCFQIDKDILLPCLASLLHSVNTDWLEHLKQENNNVTMQTYQWLESY